MDDLDTNCKNAGALGRERKEAPRFERVQVAVPNRWRRPRCSCAAPRGLRIEGSTSVASHAFGEPVDMRKSFKAVRVGLGGLGAA